MCATPPSAGYARLVRPGGARHPLPSELDWTGDAKRYKQLILIRFNYKKKIFNFCLDRTSSY